MTEPQTVDCAVLGPSFAALGRRVALTVIPQTPVDSLRRTVDCTEPQHGARKSPQSRVCARAGRMQVNETASVKYRERVGEGEGE